VTFVLARRLVVGQERQRDLLVRPTSFAGQQPALERPMASRVGMQRWNQGSELAQAGQPQNLEELEEQVLGEGLIFVGPPHREWRRQVTRRADLVQPLHGRADPALVVLAQVDLRLACSSSQASGNAV
jgi:hypothetical protein